MPYSTDTVQQIWNDATGERIELVSDRNELGLNEDGEILTEFRQVDKNGFSDGILFSDHQLSSLASTLNKFQNNAKCKNLILHVFKEDTGESVKVGPLSLGSDLLEIRYTDKDGNKLIGIVIEREQIPLIISSIDRRLMDRKDTLIENDLRERANSPLR